MNLGTPYTLSIVALSLFALVATGCSTTADSAGAQPAEEALHSKKLTVGDVCDPNADTCGDGSTCIEYTVYDHPRCKLPLATGEACTADSNCASGSCDPSNDRCAEASPSCRAPDQTCVVGEDTCCAGTTCIEYTVYDHPRCRPPLATGEACTADSECASGACDGGQCAGPGGSCRALGDTCVVGEDTCCSGSCVEYTIYDHPRCRD